MGSVWHYRKAIFLVTVELGLTKSYSNVRGLSKLLSIIPSQHFYQKILSDLQLVGNYSTDFNTFVFLMEPTYAILLVPHL